MFFIPILVYNHCEFVFKTNKQTNNEYRKNLSHRNAKKIGASSQCYVFFIFCICVAVAGAATHEPKNKKC